MTTHLPHQPAADSPPLSRRERARAATIDEIKETATRLMSEQGTTDLRFSDIAREMGMTAPALYRYFADRDELLTALIADTYDELGALVAAAREGVPADDIWGRFLAVANAYRSWASRDPVRFALILGMPVPGYAAPEDGPTTEAAKRAMSQLKAIFFHAAEQGALGPPLLTDVHEVLRECTEMEKQAHPHEPEQSPEMFQAILHSWASLHGFTSLEAHGHLNWISPEARDALFVSYVRLAAITAGLPVPDAPR
ncbi:MAG TPA: TetR/AcrR family transcriptional regulator [Jiangellaceae bacterium]